MFIYFFFYQDILADKKVGELFELKSKIDTISKEEIFHLFKKVFETVCDVFLLCKGIKVNTNGKLICDSGNALSTPIDYIIDNHLLTEDSLKIICDTKTFFADNCETNLLKIKDRISLYTLVFQEISETLRADNLKLSKPDAAEKTSKNIEWIVPTFIKRLNKFSQKEKQYVFISYKSEEEKIASKIKKILEANDINCWMAPKSIPPGSNYTREIPSAISNSNAFILILSKLAQESNWVPKEIDTAINKGVEIIPLKIDNEPLNEQFEFMLSQCQRIDAHDRLTDAYEELIRRIKKLSSPKNIDVPME